MLGMLVKAALVRVAIMKACHKLDRQQTVQWLEMKNVTQFGQSKMFKVEPFPKGIDPTEQLQEWIC